MAWADPRVDKPNPLRMLDGVSEDRLSLLERIQLFGIDDVCEVELMDVHVVTARSFAV